MYLFGINGLTCFEHFITPWPKEPLTSKSNLMALSSTLPDHAALSSVDVPVSVRTTSKAKFSTLEKENFFLKPGKTERRNFRAEFHPFSAHFLPKMLPILVIYTSAVLAVLKTQASAVFPPTCIQILPISRLCSCSFSA